MADESMMPGRGDPEGRRDRLAAAFFGLVGLWYVDSFAQAMIERTHENMDGLRLAPVFAAYRGYSLYPKAGEGPPLGYTYGPMSVLAYLPAVAAPDPTAALLGAGVLTLVYSLGPVLALLLIRTRGGSGRPGAVALGMLLFAILARNPALVYTTMSPVHDAVALGFGLLACLPLIAREAVGWRPLALSAALAAIAVLAKQNASFILPSLTLYCVLAFGPRVGLGYAALLAGIGLALGLVLIRVYGAGTLVHYLFGVQAGMPVFPSRIPGLVRQLVIMSIMPLLLIGSGLYLGRAPGEDGRSPATLRGLLTRNPGALPLMVGVGNLPIAMLGTMKLGGDSNSLSYTIYYLTAVGSLLVAEAAAKGVGPSPEFGRRSVRAVAALACVPWISFQVASAPTPIAFGWAKVVRRLRENPNQVAFDYAKRNPGSAYFPWNDLAVLMAEGKLYATEDAILNIPPPGGGRHSLKAEGMLPGSPDYVVYPPQYHAEWGKFAALAEFPNYRRYVRVPGLEKFTVFARGAAAGPP